MADESDVIQAFAEKKVIIQRVLLKKSVNGKSLGKGYLYVATLVSNWAGI